jgi:hypothetical protein
MIVRQVLKLTASLLICLAPLTLGGCLQLTRVGIGTTPIAQVVDNPSQYPQVTVRGQVVNQIAILGQGAYQLKDDSGSVWVITKSGMPAINSTVTVKGQATQGVAFAGINVAVTLKEQQRL